MTTWIKCPGCDGEIGVPDDWSAPLVACPNCAAKASSGKQSAVEWRAAPSQRTAIDKTDDEQVDSLTPKTNNPMGTTGFVLGIVSIFLFVIGIIPILAILFSSIGLATFKPDVQKNKWMAGVGLALGIGYCLHVDVFASLRTSWLMIKGAQWP